jgi:septal ring-binding cell division protein DamX
MALPTNHPTLKEVSHGPTRTSSVGGTPVACYTRVKVRGRINQLWAITQGTITSADATITVAVNGTTNTALAGTIPVASAAAGQVVNWTPTAAVYVNEGDYITWTPSGASGATIACDFGFDLHA